MNSLQTSRLVHDQSYYYYMWENLSKNGDTTYQDIRNEPHTGNKINRYSVSTDSSPVILEMKREMDKRMKYVIRGTRTCNQRLTMQNN